MSNYLHCQNLTKTYGSQTLFSGIQFGVNEGDRIGVIGPNGSGKSTFLKIICQLEDYDEGVINRKKFLTMSYLAQEDSFGDAQTVGDVLMTALEGLQLKESEMFQRVNAMLSRAEFGNSSVEVSSLSGGWSKRLAICRALVVQPEVLVMDEPTNHLDLEGIIWLEKMFSGQFPGTPSTFVIVSHDRYFLEQCANRIVEISSVYPEGTFEVSGGYSDFIEKRELFLQNQAEQESRLSNKVRRETEWLRRGPKARATKARYRIDEAYRLTDELQSVKSRNRSISQVKLDFDATGRKTKKLLTATSISKSFSDRKLFEDLDMTLSPGTRIGLLGRNGCGKSTLMKILSSPESGDELSPDSGKVVLADNVQIASFDQRREGLDKSLTLKRALAPDGDSVIYRDRAVHVVTWAKRFLFRPEQLETPVANLSGGEQARILLARLMRQKADILLLDEPTNDLDIASLEVLEESLLEFPGSVVLVSHDRYLLDRVCDLMLGFDGDGGVEYYADYAQWLTAVNEMAEEKEEKGSEEKKAEPKAKGGIKKGKLSYMDQREYDSIEDDIHHMEGELEQLKGEAELPEVVSNPGRMAELWHKIEEKEAAVEKLYLRWEELETLLEEGY